jgi:hypothetical protein
LIQGIPDVVDLPSGLVRKGLSGGDSLYASPRRRCRGVALGGESGKGGSERCLWAGAGLDSALEGRKKKSRKPRKKKPEPPDILGSIIRIGSRSAGFESC